MRNDQVLAMKMKCGRKGKPTKVDKWSWKSNWNRVTLTLKFGDGVEMQTFSLREGRPATIDEWAWNSLQLVASYCNCAAEKIKLEGEAR